MAITLFSNRLMALECTLAASCAVMAWQLTSQAIDLYMKDCFSPFQKMVIQLSVVIPLFMASIEAPIIAFLVISVASAILHMYKSYSTVAKLPPYMIDLVQEAKSMKNCPYTGQADYVDQLGVVLCQREKNNAILIGPPGTGKSAIINMLAWMIAHHQISNTSPFYGKTIVALNPSDLVAGCTLVGMLEARVQQVLEYTKRHPNVIVFVDEIHRLVGAGRAMGDSTKGVADQFKPYLARSGLSVIGATTEPEYREHIAPDAPLNRRFAPIFVKEPTEEECLKMMQNMRSQGVYKPVQVSDEAITTVLRCSQLCQGRYFPDKATSLLDAACARARYHQRPHLENQHIFQTCAQQCQIEIDRVEQHCCSTTTA